MSRPGAVVRITAVGVSIAYAAALYLSDVKLDSGVKRVLAYLPSISGFLLTAFDLWLWRLAWVQKLLPRPRVDGLWAATLTPTEGSRIPDGGNRGPIEAYVCITQTYWSMSIRQYTAESTSDSCSVSLADRPDHQRFQLAYIYENQPRQEHIDRSPRHFGGSILDITGKIPREVVGFYFTDRYTKGDMHLRLVDRKSAQSSFEAAKDHSASAAGGSPSP